jgi:hypothetical protein
VLAAVRFLALLLVAVAVVEAVAAVVQSRVRSRWLCCRGSGFAVP